MPDGKPNVLLIMADDIGWFDVGAYKPRNHGWQDTQHRPYL